MTARKHPRAKARPDHQHHAARTGTAKPARDLYQTVTDKVVAALEQGAPPWKRPWRAARNGQHVTGMLPVNALTGNGYSGVNVLLLWMAAEEAGYGLNRWLTYRQAQQLGGQVRKGEVSTLAVIYKDWRKPAEDEHGNRLYDSEGNPLTEVVPVLKANLLFNVAQCDGLPAHLTALPVAEADPVPEDSRDTVSADITERVLKILNATGVTVISAPQDRAYYAPYQDRIVMPLSSQFFTQADYWSTLLHEMVHSSGHADRLNREGITAPGRRFGDPVYSAEELIAEMGSAFLCAQLEVTGEVNHEGYVGHWLDILRADKRALFRACRHAREASEWLLAQETGNAARAA